MKLREYLQQFEGLDPNMEIYLEVADYRGIASGQIYKRPKISGFVYDKVFVKPNHFTYTDFVLYGGKEYNTEVLLMMRL